MSIHLIIISLVPISILPSLWVIPTYLPIVVVILTLILSLLISITMLICVIVVVITRDKFDLHFYG